MTTTPSLDLRRPGLPEVTWTPICRLADLLPERGVAALVDTPAGRTQVAVFRCHDDALYAVSQRDPFSGANVISRGIVGTRGSTPTVASPMFKQVFDLTTGICLDDPDNPQVRLRSYPVRVQAGLVELGTPTEPDASG
jgi:nitrite reductase (NADH) small subunit